MNKEVLYEDIYGQETSKVVLKSISNSPQNSPKMIILCGPSGVGKTTLSKAFINEMSKQMLIDGCGLSFYKEYSSYLLDTEQSLEVLQNDSDNYIYLIEDLDKMSYKMQMLLLDKIDSIDNKIFIFTIEDITKVLGHLKNRSLILDLDLLSDSDMLEFLEEYIKSKGIDISKEDINLIVSRAKGNVRLAKSLVDRREKLSKEVYDELVSTARESYIKFILASFMQDKDKASKALVELIRFPLRSLKEDYESLLLEIMKVRVGVVSKRDKYIKALYSVAMNKVLDLFNIMNDKVIYDMFDTDDNFQSSMWVIYIRIGKMNK